MIFKGLYALTKIGFDLRHGGIGSGTPITISVAHFKSVHIFFAKELNLFAIRA